MYMMRRVHAEQNPEGGHMNVWVMQWEDADLNGLIKTARFNLNPLKKVSGGNMWEDHAPDQNKLPGCLWQGRVDKNFKCNDSMVHSITHCMIFNISKCWYSPVLSRETSDSDNALIYFNCKVDDKVYPSFLTIKECVDYLTSPEGIGICSNRDIKPVEVKK